MEIDDENFDLAVIGAGINGAGIARDAAMRGMRVVVFDQGDMCSGTSAISSRLIHGGLRYLEYGEIPLVFESLRERITLRKTAEHLVKPIRICIPIYESARRGPLLIRIGMLLYDFLSVGKTVPGHDMLSREEAIAAEPGLESHGLRAAARYFDAQVDYAERLVLENLLAARAAGAKIRTYSRVEQIHIDQGAVSGLSFRDTITGKAGRCAATVIVNAAGPWVDDVLDKTGSSASRFIGGTKGSHIIVSPFDGAPKDAYYVEAKADGRPFFIIPWIGLYLIGTTDIRYDGDLGAVRASQEEVEYLLAETNRVFPNAQLKRADIHYAYAGVRPLPRRKHGPESSITRKHIIKMHRRVATGLISIIGGKLTTYRNLAEQTVDAAARLIKRKLPACRTRNTKLPGAHRLSVARKHLESSGLLSEEGVERMIGLYGGRADDILSLAQGDLEQAIDDRRTVLAAEVVFAIRDEFARNLIDIVHRRIMVGLDADQGRPLYASIASLAAEEFGWDDATRDAELAALIAYSESLGV